MGGNKKDMEEKPVVAAEFRVSMHCNACERKVAKAINKIKGVEEFTTDMMNHKVVIIGRINPEKVVKKLKKKTGKRVEVVVMEDGEEGENGEDLGFEDGEDRDSWLANYYENGDETHMVFNDENVNACFVM